MTLKAAQTQPKLPAQVPQFYDEDLVKRCFPIRFRNIGDPNAFLDELGITPILEFIYKGHVLIEAAEAINVSFTRLRKWIEQNNHFEAIEEAETLSAEGFLAEGLKRLRTAPTEFELRRAKAIIDHAKFMAENKNKRLYAGGVDKAPPAQVSYVFNIGAATPEQVHAAKEIIDSTASRVPAPPASVSHTPALDPDLFGVPEPPSEQKRPKIARGIPIPGLEHTEDKVTVDLNHLAHQPLLTHPRPVRPTAVEPDIGPFYDDPLDQENEILPEHYTQAAEPSSHNEQRQ